MPTTILWGDDHVPVLARDWQRHLTRQPYRKTYRLRIGERWQDAPTTEAQREHYVEVGGGIIPAGAAVARELMTAGAVVALWTEVWGRRTVFMSPDCIAVEPSGELSEILQRLHAANDRRWAGLPDVIALFSDGRVMMREAKVEGKDRITKTQHAFARIARAVLGSRLDLAVVEWGGEKLKNI